MLHIFLLFKALSYIVIAFKLDTEFDDPAGGISAEYTKFHITDRAYINYIKKLNFELPGVFVMKIQTESKDHLVIKKNK
jgi:hypothetical protein